jgi:hypothetical protein
LLKPLLPSTAKLDSSFLTISKTTLFFTPKKKFHLTKKTHKKWSFCRFRSFSLPSGSANKNKYLGSLNLWTIYILCVIFSGWRSFFVHVAWWFYWAGFVLRSSSLVDSCNWFLTWIFFCGFDSGWDSDRKFCFRLSRERFFLKRILWTLVN